jgi:hypothetical protein
VILAAEVACAGTGQPIETGLAAPSGLVYAENPAVYTVGLAIAANVPRSGGGAVASYTVSPDLPAGLSLDPATGVISGTPAAAAGAATYLVLASNAAGSAVAALNVAVETATGVFVDVSPKGSWVEVSGVKAFSATVTGTLESGVTWSIEPAGNGTIVPTGPGAAVFTAPPHTGTYQVVARSVADASAAGSTSVDVVPTQPVTPYVLAADRATAWRPGVTYNGGIPARTTVCGAAVSPLGGGLDDSAQIQAAIDACPVGEVVQLGPGTFVVNNLVLVPKGITIRGAGAGTTVLSKTNGAVLNVDGAPDIQPVIVVGTARWAHPDDTTSRDLAADGVKGDHSVTVTNGSDLVPGEIVLLDERSGARWMTDPAGRGRIWASPDLRVVWQKHDPSQIWDDFAADEFPSGPGGAGSWFCRQDRPTAEVKEIASVRGNVVTFTSPLHISYRTSHAAQLTRYGGVSAHVRGAGIEALTVEGGSDGAVRFEAAAYSWAKNVEVRVWVGEGFAADASFRVEIRDSYVHDAAFVSPGGGAYAISMSSGTAETLVENSIAVRANKVMVARSSGAGSVFGYNYVDHGYIRYVGPWIEVHLNASHMVGPHHVLFEGNHGANFDSDNTHGNSTYMTVFRNHLRGIRSAFDNQVDGSLVDDAVQDGNGPRRCVGAMTYSYWMTFVGNVLGEQDRMAGWAYDVSGPEGMSTPSIFLLGWDGNAPYPHDAAVEATALRDGNWDWLQARQSWHDTAPGVLPDSLYLGAKPAFFGANPWPWVDPTTGTVHTLPAKARYDGGTPNVVP